MGGELTAMLHLGTLVCEHCGHRHVFTLTAQPPEDLSRCAACGGGLRGHSQWIPWTPDPDTVVQITPAMVAQSRAQRGEQRCILTGGEGWLGCGDYALSLKACLHAYAWVWTWDGTVVDGPGADLEALHMNYLQRLEARLPGLRTGSFERTYTEERIAAVRAGERCGEIARRNYWEELTKPPFIEPTPDQYAHLMPAQIGRVAPGKWYYTFDWSWKSWVIPLLQRGNEHIPVHPKGAYGVEVAHCVGGGDALHVYDVLVDVAAAMMNLIRPRVLVVHWEMTPRRNEADRAGFGACSDGAVVRQIGKVWHRVRVSELDGDDLRGVELARIANFVLSDDFRRQLRALAEEEPVVDEELYQYASANREPLLVPGVRGIPIKDLHPMDTLTEALQPDDGTAKS